jgi:SAM-dependent methyltransferase
MQAEIVNDFYDLAIDRKMYSNKPNLKYRLNFFFDKVSLADKNVLDVGGGIGLLTFYAAVKGAKKVVCLEPEFDGSSSGMINKFNEFKSNFQTPLPIAHLPLTLQDYLKQIDDAEYDIILLHNSINHLDEQACVTFRENAESYNTYKDIFNAVFQKMKSGGKLVVADCSCNNFLNALGFTSYFNPTIEWHKHQTPKTWIGLLKEIGFKNPKISWTSPNRFGHVGRLFMGNAFISYLTFSHFKFIMDK